MGGRPVELRVDDGLARVTLNQPTKGNVFSQDSSRQFCDAVTAIVDRADVRAVLIAGRGKNFSFGGDLDGITGDLDRLPAYLRGLTADLHLAMARLARIDAPVIVQVQGFAMGGAVALIASCDLVLSGRSAHFGAAYAGIGLTCDLGATFGLASRMGLARARRFLLLGETLDADEAEQAGLVDQLFDDDELEAGASALATRLSQGPTKAFGEVRRLMSRVFTQPFEAQLEDEAQAMARAATSADALEGITAFIEKRAPHFVGH